MISRSLLGAPPAFCLPSQVCLDDGSAWVDEQTCDEVQGLACDANSGECTGACANLGTSYIGCDYYPVVTQQLDAYVGGNPYAVAVALAALQSAAIFQMKASRVWFSMSTDTAVNFWGNGIITASDCESKTPNLGARMGITEVEVAAICNTFKKPTLQKDLHASIESQRMISFVLISMLLWFATFPYLEFSKGAHAHELYKRLQKKAKSNQTGGAS